MEPLEDLAGELGLRNDWDAVTNTINLLVKRQKRIEKLIIQDLVELSDDVSTTKVVEGMPAPIKIEEPRLDELIKDI